MKPKTAAQIQAELDLIRLAYRRKQDQIDTRLWPLVREAVPYLIVGGLASSAIAYILALFLS